MLVINRKVGETVNIEHKGEVLKLIVVKQRGDDELVLGFEGSRSFDISRDDASKKKRDVNGNR